MPQDIGLTESVSEKCVRNIAVLQRMLSVRRKPFTDMDSRASWFLKRLEQPDDSLRFRLLLESLRLHFDLLAEESAMDRIPCQLQVRVLELAADYPTARKMAYEMLAEAPISILFFSIMSQAIKSGSDTVRFVFPTHEDKRFRHLVLTPIGWTETMVMPPNIANALRGYVNLVETAEYGSVKPYVKFRGTLAQSIGFKWIDDATLEIALN